MTKYIVDTLYTCEFQKELTIYAQDEEEAEEKAHDLVSGWRGVTEVTIHEVYKE